AAAGINELRGDRLAVSRLGRGQRWDASPGAARAVTALDATQAPPPSQPTSPVKKAAASPPWIRWALIAAAGALLGGIAILATQRRPKRLSRTERDAV
ncbi:hypothetical protein, partial [Listeria seeligeri]|uniref:hypothetical protein n=1 Tax=Listeria seeligeri TaxID=1640 RepID=UPI0022EBB2A6